MGQDGFKLSKTSQDNKGLLINNKALANKRFIKPCKNGFLVLIHHRQLSPSLSQVLLFPTYKSHLLQLFSALFLGRVALFTISVVPFCALHRVSWRLETVYAEMRDEAGSGIRDGSSVSMPSPILMFLPAEDIGL